MLEQDLRNVGLAAAACKLLRQLANSDAIKRNIVGANGLELLAGVLTAHQGEGQVLEQVLFSRDLSPAGALFFKLMKICHRLWGCWWP